MISILTRSLFNSAKSSRFVVAFILINAVLINTNNALANTEPAQLKQTLADIKPDSAERIPVLVDIVKHCWFRCVDDAILYGEEALDLLLKYPNADLEADLIGYYTRIYIDRGDYSKVETLLARGLQAAKSSTNDKAITNNQYNQAIYYTMQDKFVLALDAYFQLEATYLRLNKMKSVGNLYNNIGNLYPKLGNLGKALEYFQKAVPILEEHSRPADLANTLMNIGQVYVHQEDYQQALENTLRGLSLVTEESTPLHFTEANLRLSWIYTNLADYDEAFRYFAIAETTASKHSYATTLMTLYFNGILLGIESDNIEFSNRQLAKAKAALKESMAPTYHSALDYYEAEIAIEQEQWIQAEQLLQPLVDKQLFEQGFYDELDFSKSIATVKENLGKLDEAHNIVKSILEQYKTNVDTNNQAQAQQYAQLYKSSEKERKIALLEEKNAQQQLQALMAEQEKKLLIAGQIAAALVFMLLLIFGYQRRRALQREARLTKRLMDNKNQMLADISHELRTPFSVLKLQVEALQYNLEEDTDKAHQRLHSKISQLTNLIADIDELAQADALVLSLKKRDVQLYRMIKDCGAEMRPAFESAGLTLSVDNQISKKLTASLDLHRVKQIISNLLGNSLRYTDVPGGTFLRASVKDACLSICIEDSSPGVPEGELKAIFERLYRVEKSRNRTTGGTGLGLSICRSLVELHEGTIHAEKSELGGLKIVIRIPI